MDLSLVPVVSNLTCSMHRKCVQLVVLLAVFLGLTSMQSVQHVNAAVPTKVIWGVPGKDVELPCNVTPSVPSDAVNMVFWFKDTIGTPLYSLDARGGPLNQASHLAMSDDLGTRSYFITDADPSSARLKIQKVTANDEGVFRCRVDFINSPTRNFRLNLSLVEQPTYPRIFDAKGKEVLADAGPFLEGTELFLSCQVTGGRPTPSLIWWYNDTVLDAVVDTRPTALTTVNQLVITRVARTLRGGRLECRTTAAEEAGAIVREVPITVYLKPNKVKIVSPNKMLTSNKPATVVCETSGSYPPAVISWLLDGKPIRNAVYAEDDSLKASKSLITFSPFPEDDGKDLSCRADNPRFPGGGMTDKRIVSVAYPPKVAVRIDYGTTNPAKEGTFAALRCETEATPQAHSYSWYHNGHLIVLNETAGLFPRENILNLTSITKLSQGDYSCSATNTEGETYSGPYFLQVQYAPRCALGHEVMRVGAVAFEGVAIQCHVDAIPPVTRFHWTYNTSKGVLPMQGGKMQNRAGVSTLHFTPGTADIDSLACWASNSVGHQAVPCLFFIVPAYNPEPPHNCNLQNATGGGLEVACTAGRDGGLQQTFILEVVVSSTGAVATLGPSTETGVSTSAPGVGIPPPLGAAQPPTLLDPTVVTTLSDQGDHYTPLYRVLGETPVFRLHSLESGREYQLLVYAVNAKGRSDPPVLLSNIRVDFADDGDSDGEQGYRHITDLDSINDSSSAVGLTSPNLTVILVCLAVLAIILILAIVIAASVLACKRQPTSILLRHRTPLPPGTTATVRTLRRSSKPPEELELSEAGFNEGFHRRSAQYRASMYAIDVDGEAMTPTATGSFGRHLSTGPDLILSPSSFTATQHTIQY